MFFQNLPNNNQIKHYCRNTSLGGIFAERLNRTIRDLLKGPVFETGDGNWIDILLTITKQYNNLVHSLTKFTPIQASLKKNEVFVFQILLDKRKRIKPKFQVNDLVRTVDLKKTFTKSDTTNWSYILYKITVIINETIPAYKLDTLPERYNEVLLKQTELPLKKK